MKLFFKLIHDNNTIEIEIDNDPARFSRNPRSVWVMPVYDQIIMALKAKQARNLKN